MDIEALAEDDWKVLQNVRLTALKESPDAFLYTYQDEADWSEARWRTRISTDTWMVVRIDQQVVAVACTVRPDDRPTDERHLESVWVDPLHRRRGVLRAILRYLIESNPDVHTWMAWVLDGNDDARAAYQRVGFESTGERQALTEPRPCIEERLRLDRNAAISASTDPEPAS